MNDYIHNKNRFDEVKQLVSKCDFVNARDVLEEMIKSGDDDAYLYMGAVYELEPQKNVILDYEKSYNYYKKSIDKTGSLDAYIAIAHILSKGYLGSNDDDGAMNIYIYLVEQGFSKSGFLFWMVGVRYTLGKGAIKNLDLGEKYLKKAVEDKHIPSLYWLGRVYLKKTQVFKGVWFFIYGLIKWLLFLFFNKHSPRIYVQ